MLLMLAKEVLVGALLQCFFIFVWKFGLDLFFNWDSFSRPEPTSHFTCGIAAIMKWGKTNGIYLVVFPA